MKLPWKYMTITFLVGILFGAAGGFYGSKIAAKRWMRRMPEMFLRRLDRNLALNPGQKTAILEVLQSAHSRIMASHDAIRQETRSEIRKLLDNHQQTEFDAMMTRHDAKRRRNEAR